EGVMTLISPEYEMEKLKQATRAIPELIETVVSGDPTMMAHEPEVEEDDQEMNATNDVQPDEADGEESKPKKRRRRRRRRKSNETSANDEESEETTSNEDASNEPSKTDPDESTVDVAPKSTRDQSSQTQEISGHSEDGAEGAPKKPAQRRRKRPFQKEVTELSLESSETTSQRASTKEPDADQGSVISQEPSTPEALDVEINDTVAEKPKRKSAPRKRRVEAEVTPETVSDEAPPVAVATKPEPKPKPVKRRARKPKAVKKETEAAPAAPESEVSIDLVKETKATVKEVKTPTPMEMPDQSHEATEADKPRRRGWWSRG
ncbi:MAG: hypothetical protein P8I83_11145, partial [Paracoccaceae bacterium]|nr:hypothetical protein [Paracoccaceae bacterium]